MNLNLKTKMSSEYGNRRYTVETSIYRVERIDPNSGFVDLSYSSKVAGYHDSELFVLTKTSLMLTFIRYLVPKSSVRLQT